MATRDIVQVKRRRGAAGRAARADAEPGAGAQGVLRVEVGTPRAAPHPAPGNGASPLAVVDLTGEVDAVAATPRTVERAQRERVQPARAARRSPRAKPPAPRIVYLLVNSKWTHTYVGSTTDMKRRLRQHNREIVGGAWCTSLQVKQGNKWNRALHVKGFESDAAAYKFEYDWKQLNKKWPRKGPVHWRKVRALRKLIPRGALQPEVEWGTVIDLTFDE